MARSNSCGEVSPRAVSLRVYTRFEQGKVIASVAVVGEAEVADGASVELQLLQPSLSGEKVLQRRRIKQLLPGGRNEVVFSVSGLRSGCCVLHAELTDRNGQKLETRMIQDAQPPFAEWLGSREGISRKAPPPWTPLKTRGVGSGLVVECWGRTYTFGRTSLLERMQSGGRALLAAPVRLTGKVNGRRITWRGESLRRVADEQGRVVLSRSFTNASLLLRTETQVDFDGMVRFDCRLSAKKATQLDSLTLEIPMPARHAKYLCQFPSRHWISGENPGQLPAKGLTLGFRPFLWLGDDERGLAWFCESDENWFSRDPGRVTQIVRKGDAVILRLRLVSTPIAIAPAGGDAGGKMTIFGVDNDRRVVPGLSYTFGFQATPVKPVETDAWDHRIYCIGIDAAKNEHKQPLQISSSLLDKLAASGVRTVVIFEYWTDIESHAKTTHGRELKKLVRACHDRGLNVLLYFGFLISDLAPEWSHFGEQCIVVPKSGYPIFHYLPQPEQSAWRVCLRSVWQDFVVSGIASAMDEFGVDGVYLDGTEYPFRCSNTLHGCGTLRPDESIAPTYPIFATRSAMRRIYEAVRSRKPDGQIDVHNSRCMTIPTLGWATSSWDGEQFQNFAKGSEMKRALPLDAFRAEFMGRQWGVPAEFLCYGNALTYQQAWAITLLHDVPVRPSNAENNLSLASAVWKAMDDFCRKEAEWLPYWRNGEYVKASPEGIYVTLYRHARNGVLAVVSNLSGKGLSCEVRISLSRLRLKPEDTTAYDAMTEELVKMKDGRIKCSLASFDWRLIRIKGN